MWTSDVDTTAAMMKDTANTAPLTIISRLAPNIFTKTPTKIPIKCKPILELIELKINYQMDLFYMFASNYKSVY